MSFVSDLGAMTVIDDAFDLATMSKTHGRGLLSRDFTAHPHGSLPFAAKWTRPTIPRSEWAERIKDLEKAKARIPDICDAFGLVVKNQSNTNFCWANAPVHCLEIMRIVQGQDHVSLSPASVACKINGFKNEGGWDTEALKYLATHGAVPSSLWPDNAIDRSRDTAAANAERAKYQVTEWDDLEPRNFDQLMTSVLQCVPVAIGLSWWGHEVTAVAGVVLDGGRFGMIISNSWGTTWQDKGRGVLTESKATPYDAVAPRSVTAS